MIQLNKTLKKKTSYINSYSYFTKSLIIKDNIKNNTSNLIICEGIENIREYKKIFSFLGKNINIIESRNDLSNLIFNKEKLFFCESSLVDKAVVDNNFLESENLSLYKGQAIGVENIVDSLNKLGYSFSEANKNASYKKLGDTITITSINGNTEYKISLWGDSIDSINKSEVISNLATSFSEIEKLSLGNNTSLLDDNDNKSTTTLLKILENSEDIFSVLDMIDFSIVYDKLILCSTNLCSFDYIGNKTFNIKDLEIAETKIDNIDTLLSSLKESLISEKYIYTKNISVIKNFLEYNNIENIIINETKLNNLKSFKTEKIIVICDDIINKVSIRKRTKKSLSTDMDLLLKIKSQDYIVHIDHGIGIFKGIVNKHLGKIRKVYVEIEYSNNDKLFVPITEVSRIHKYVGPSNPKLTGLNTNTWQKKLDKVSVDVQAIASELLDIYSKRKIHSGFEFIIDRQKMSTFMSSFQYIYTQDQNTTVEEILSDMSKNKPMDRLVVGDVGYGKTEIAFNAIYNCINNKKQAVLISPLVVLSYEHYEKALKRFKDFGVNIKVMTRLESTKSINETMVGLKKGTIDLVIGTHKLFNENIEYKNLGLMVIDEEHKFGSMDKEKIKKYKSSIDILSMSATPIPRTLNMALSSIRDMSIIKTAPYGRQNIKTVVSPFNENNILLAMEKEFERGGQVFFIHNRVKTIGHFEKIISSLFPKKKIIITHGQLPGQELEKRIIDFKHRKHDVLLSTTVIENGIDFSNVNTIIINDAESFGMSTIHQLRGRVGRSDRKGYCHLLYKKQNLKKDQIERLKTIVEYSYLGAGFELAMKDLEIRGGGDLLGVKQSGQASEIGVNLFIKMIEEQINKLKLNIDTSDGKISKNKEEKNKINLNTKIDLNIECYLEDNLFGSELDKINFYREIESINSMEELENIILDFKNINPDLPKPAINLFDMLKLKIKASNYSIKSIKRLGINYVIDFDTNISIEELKSFLGLDKEVKFTVVNITKLKTDTKNFLNNDKEFMDYILKMFDRKISNKKIKLKRKKST